MEWPEVVVERGNQDSRYSCEKNQFGKIGFSHQMTHSLRGRVQMSTLVTTQRTIILMKFGNYKGMSVFLYYDLTINRTIGSLC